MTCGHIAGFSKRVTSGYLADLYPARFSVGGLWSGPYLIHGDHGHGCSLSWWVGVLDVLQQQAGVGAAAAATAFIQPQPLDIRLPAGSTIRTVSLHLRVPALLRQG